MRNNDKIDLGPVRRMSQGERLLVDVLEETRFPEMVLYREIDMTAAEAFRRTLGAGVTIVALVVKAAALALRIEPALRRIPGGKRLIEPSTTDVSLSVAASGNVSPMILIERADTLGLEALAREVGRKAKEARAKEAATQKLVERAGKILFFGPLRRFLVRMGMGVPEVHRHVGGSIQISTIPLGIDFAFSTRQCTPVFVSFGQVKARPFVVEGEVKARRTMIVGVSVDGRVGGPDSTARYTTELARFLEHPRTLEAGAPWR